MISGSIRLDGQELIGLDESDYCKLRGNRVSMIFQEPMTALNPMHTIGRQIAEPLRRHKGLSATQARNEAIALLDRVGLPDAARRVDAYPHQFSGGQRQRITIAMALACEPDLLIADEPTTALDVTIQGQILDLIADLVAERGMSMILISHDLGVIAENVQRMMVMYGGTVVENGEIETLFAGLGHPYSQGLFRARPQLGATKGTRLQTIAGTVPELADLPAGCAFADRCDIAEARCRAIFPPPVTVKAGHTVRCLRTDVSMANRIGDGDRMSTTAMQRRTLRPNRRCSKSTTSCSAIRCRAKTCSGPARRCWRSTASACNSRRGKVSAWSVNPARANPPWRAR